MRELLTQFRLPVDLSSFVNYWLDGEWNSNFLRNGLKDQNISVGAWESSDPTTLRREINSLHPSNLSFPGLPSHAPSRKIQYVALPSADEPLCVRMKETNSFRDIPYSDYFKVLIYWVVTCESNGNCESKTDGNASGNETNTENTDDPDEDTRNLLSSSSQNNQWQCNISIYVDFDFVKSTWLQSTIESNTRAELTEVYERWHEHARRTLEWALSNRNYPSYMLNGEERFFEPSFFDLSGEELEEYRVNKGAAMTPAGVVAAEKEEDEVKINTLGKGDRKKKQEKLDLSSLPRHKSSKGSTERPVLTRSRSEVERNPFDEIRSTKEMAVTLVEVLFVLTAFVFWKGHQLYTKVADMFFIHPTDVWLRVKGSFYPGAVDLSILMAPDAWGPMNGVLTLPLVLLLSIEVRQTGCNQSSTLGNALLICISTWIILSTFFRLIAMVVAPSLKVSHCLCIVGYGYYPWSTALFSSYILGHILDVPEFVGKIPIILIGLSSSAAQAYIFWRSAPNHEGNTTIARVRQTLHFLGVVLVMLVHYAFLNYFNFIYLKEKKELCHLKAIVDFHQYFAIHLVSKGVATN